MFFWSNTLIWSVDTHPYLGDDGDPGPYDGDNILEPDFQPKTNLSDLRSSNLSGFITSFTSQHQKSKKG
jgi:hypothetical protein